MRYSVRLSIAAKKDLTSFSSNVLDELANKHFPEISRAPRKVGKPKKGILSGVLGYNWGPKGGYRILYEIYENEKVVLIIAIGAHDQAYRKASRRI